MEIKFEWTIEEFYKLFGISSIEQVNTLNSDSTPKSIQDSTPRKTNGWYATIVELYDRTREWEFELIWEFKNIRKAGEHLWILPQSCSNLSRFVNSDKLYKWNYKIVKKSIL